MKTANQKTRRNSRASQNSEENYTIGSTSFVRVRDYKRAMRKQFNEMKRALTSFSSGMESMPADERSQVKSMMKTVDSTHRRLMKWWSR